MYRNAVSSSHNFSHYSINNHRNTLKNLRYYDCIKQENIHKNTSKYLKCCGHHYHTNNNRLTTESFTKHCCDDRKTDKIDLLYKKSNDTLKNLIHLNTTSDLISYKDHSKYDRPYSRSSVLYVSKIYRYEKYRY